MGQAPSQPGPPGTKFRVIGAGMCRTGTKTFNEALTILLNGPVHDAGVQSLGGSWHQINRWLEIMKLAPKAKTLSQKKYLQYCLADILDGYVATVDSPAIALTPELIELYPDALVIATTRDPESWWKSMNLVNGMMANWYIVFIIMFVPKIGVYGRWRVLLMHLSLWRYGDPNIHEGTLKKHEDHLKAVVPPEKLYWYNVKDGWEPLCKILGVPVPDVPFPHNNSSHEAGLRYKEAITAGVISWTFVLAMWYAIYWFFWGRSEARGISGLFTSALHR